MRKTAFFFLVLFVSCAVDAQVVRRPPPQNDCPEPDSWVCQMWPNVCEECVPEPGVFRRVIPTIPQEPLLIPKGIGVVVAWSDIPKNDTAGYTEGWNIAIEKNAVSASVLAGLGLRTSKFWPRAHAFGPDMAGVYNNPDMDVIVVRPMQSAWSDAYGTCISGQSMLWVTEDYGQIAFNLYERFGDLDKVIILTGWETDHLVRGLGCDYSSEYGKNYEWYVRNLLNARQQGVEWAREMHPDATLRVYHCVDVNDIDDEWNAVRDLGLEPDMWSLSYWKWGVYTITEMLDYIEDVTGYNRSRIIIGEIGGPVDKQYDRIISAATDAFDWGCPLVYIWIYVQKWGGDNFGMWAKDEDGFFTGEWTQGMDAILEVNEAYN